MRGSLSSIEAQFVELEKKEKRLRTYFQPSMDEFGNKTTGRVRHRYSDFLEHEPLLLTKGRARTAEAPGNPAGEDGSGGAEDEAATGSALAQIAPPLGTVGEGIGTVDLLDVVRAQAREAASTPPLDDVTAQSYDVLQLKPKTADPSNSRRVERLEREGFNRLVLSEALDSWHHINAQLSTRAERIRHLVEADEAGIEPQSPLALPELFEPKSSSRASTSSRFAAVSSSSGRTKADNLHRPPVIKGLAPGQPTLTSISSSTPAVASGGSDMMAPPGRGAGSLNVPGLATSRARSSTVMISRRAVPGGEKPMAVKEHGTMLGPRSSGPVAAVDDSATVKHMVVGEEGGRRNSIIAPAAVPPAATRSASLAAASSPESSARRTRSGTIRPMLLPKQQHPAIADPASAEASKEGASLNPEPVRPSPLRGPAAEPGAGPFKMRLASFGTDAGGSSDSEEADGKDRFSYGHEADDNDRWRSGSGAHSFGSYGSGLGSSSPGRPGASRPSHAPQRMPTFSVPVGSNVTRDATIHFEKVGGEMDPYELQQTGEHLKDNPAIPGVMGSRTPGSRRRITSLRRRTRQQLRQSKFSTRPEASDLGPIPELPTAGQDVSGVAPPLLGSPGSGAMDEIRPPVVSRHSPEFYYLNVKIVHQKNLATWRFKVVLTDITSPNHKVLTFRNVQVNADNYVIFHPPDGITLSPAEDFPWVSAPAELFGHALRIEVYGILPTRTRVVDSVVFFGDGLPEAPWPGMPSELDGPDFSEDDVAGTEMVQAGTGNPGLGSGVGSVPPASDTSIHFRRPVSAQRMRAQSRTPDGASGNAGLYEYDGSLTTTPSMSRPMSRLSTDTVGGLDPVEIVQAEVASEPAVPRNLSPILKAARPAPKPRNAAASLAVPGAQPPVPKTRKVVPNLPLAFEDTPHPSPRAVATEDHPAYRRKDYHGIGGSGDRSDSEHRIEPPASEKLSQTRPSPRTRQVGKFSIDQRERIETLKALRDTVRANMAEIAYKRAVPSDAPPGIMVVRPAPKTKLRPNQNPIH